MKAYYESFVSALKTLVFSSFFIKMHAAALLAISDGPVQDFTKKEQREARSLLPIKMAARHKTDPPAMQNYTRVTLSNTIGVCQAPEG